MNSQTKKRNYFINESKSGIMHYITHYIILTNITTVIIDYKKCVSDCKNNVYFYF